MSAKRSQSVKDRLKAAKLPERSLQVCLRGDLQAEFDDLERQLREAREAPAATGKRIGSKPEALAIVERQAAIREQMADEMLDLLIRALPRADYVDESGEKQDGWVTLVRKNPPRPGNEGDEAMGVNLEGLMEVAVPRCVAEPALDEDDWERLNSVLTSGDWDRVMNTVWSVNRSGVDVPKSRLASLVMAESAADSR